MCPAARLVTVGLRRRKRCGPNFSLFSLFCYLLKRANSIVHIITYDVLFQKGEEVILRLKIKKQINQITK